VTHSASEGRGQWQQSTGSQSKTRSKRPWELSWPNPAFVFQGSGSIHVTLTERVALATLAVAAPFVRLPSGAIAASATEPITRIHPMQICACMPLYSSSLRRIPLRSYLHFPSTVTYATPLSSSFVHVHFTLSHLWALPGYCATASAQGPRRTIQRLMAIAHAGSATSVH
jgi:hypothetical protein